MTAPRCAGVIAGFADADALVAAARRLIEIGYTRVEAYAPYAIDSLPSVLGGARDRIAPMMLAGGLTGGLGMLAIEAWTAIVAYPIHVGGRPTASWPAFLPAAIEMTLLGAALFGVFAMLRGSGLPRLHHPLFGVERFETASRDGFFIVVRADDPCFSPDRVLEDIDALRPMFRAEVPA